MLSAIDTGALLELGLTVLCVGSGSRAAGPPPMALTACNRFVLSTSSARRPVPGL